MRMIQAIGCLLMFFASSAALAVETQSTTGSNEPEIGPDNSVPAPSNPVATGDSDTLICPTGGGRFTSYEVVALENGANCEKTNNAGVNGLGCWVGNRFVGGASCGGKGTKPGCMMPNVPGISECNVGQGRVTK